MSDESPWLDARQQHVWREWLAINAQLPTALHKQLQEDSGLSLPDFDVLVRLTETPGTRVRIVALANALGWERSRLSHHVKRMQARGLIEREDCPDDGRGAFVALTPTGREAIERAAPEHARTVRELVFDALTDDELAMVAQFTDKVLTRLQRERNPSGEGLV